jgi:hypothetical protein
MYLVCWGVNMYLSYVLGAIKHGSMYIPPNVMYFVREMIECFVQSKCKGCHCNKNHMYQFITAMTTVRPDVQELPMTMRAAVTWSSFRSIAST